MSASTSRPLPARPPADDLPAGGSGAMFDHIAGRYDLLNRIISLGLDRRWRRQLVAALELKPGQRVLDLATGTADVVLEILRRQPRLEVVGLDPSPRMLAVARRKLARAGAAERVVLRRGRAEALPFEDASFDALSIAFGIRNVPDRPAALRQMARVVRPAGRVAILELGEPRVGVLTPLARWYVHRLVPAVGGWLSGAREYAYLEHSIAAFPPPGRFAELMARHGLEVLAVHALAFGACHLYVARPAAGVREEAR
ncbi:MAG: bifunctional demethylmenaquinone methyltransferase/2-methoxy-6-polyprenyl-1,4-benzoquinol methylase UbiE [Acidobacteria bacterium]|nr:MAG: bifunctional demethylmenaquinone methyltransferase/2-methoxy-6-polyprenyl-1,4-benzoquinol methylase UbiE [Acidobacteriota bacterium]